MLRICDLFLLFAKSIKLKEFHFYLDTGQCFRNPKYFFQNKICEIFDTNILRLDYNERKISYVELVINRVYK